MNGNSIFQSGQISHCQECILKQKLEYEADDQSRVSVNKSQVALRALACPTETNIPQALNQIPKGTQVSRSSKLIFGRETYKGGDGMFY